MKCKTCNQEIKETPIGETIIAKELNLEVQREVTQKNVAFKDIVIPKGWRLMTYIEAVELANSKYAKELKMDGSSLCDDFFIKQPFKFNEKNNYVAGFSASSVGAYLSCDGNPGGTGASLGVRFVRDLKKKIK